MSTQKPSTSKRIPYAGIITHGHSRVGQRSSTYLSWQSMRDRCIRPNRIKYKTYGALGITFCERWDKFENFLADMGARPEGKTLDRIDNLKGYFPDNCRWATRKEQQRNRNHRVMVTYRGETRILAEWVEMLSLNYPRVRLRLKNGWSVERAFSEPVHADKQFIRKGTS